ncbi:DnaJ-domain-containing protein [Backusella circina FSU 941]|nr:DnaJ-domain-containing protein [Backusella circina FSU 941]
MLILIRTLHIQRSLKRCYSSNKKNGPSQEKVKAIPFAQHVKAAEKTFQDFHGTGFFSARTTSTGPPDEAFLPFWVVSANIHATIEQAQVGRRVMRVRYNPATKQNESRWETDWAWVQDKHTFQREYIPLAHPELQIYGSHRYRRGLVSKITTGPALENTVPFSSQLLDRPKGEDENYRMERKVDPFTLYPTTALRFAQAYIQTHEEQLADQYLRHIYSMDETRLLKINIQYENVRVSPVYYPTFIYTVPYLGRNLRTFINGHDLTVGGIKVYNWERVAVVSAGLATTAMLATGGVSYGGASGSFWLGIVAPALLTSFVTMYYPLFSLYVRDVMRRREIQSMAQDPATWDSDWVKGYAAFEDQQRYRTWREEKQRTWSNKKTNSGGVDPKGYYDTLGVSTNASQPEIQSAFRGLAMKYHPDRFSKAEEKNKAKVKFQAISNAYSVLRDPKKRQLYDQTGRD